MRRLVLAVACWICLPVGVAIGQQQEAPQLVFNAGGHTAAVNKLCFLDEERLVSVSNDKTIRIWNLRSGESADVLRPPIGPGLAGVLYAVDVSPDRRWLAAAGFEYPGSDHGIWLVRLSDHQVAGVLRGHTNVVIDLRFSPDSRLLASGSADNTARVWDVATRQSHLTLRGHRDGVYGVAFAPDSGRLATASLDGTIRTWSLESGTTIDVLEGHRGAVQAVDWSPDGRLIAAGSVDHSLSLWTPEGRRIGWFSNLGNHVTSVRFTRDSRRLLYTLGGAGQRDGGFLLEPLEPPQEAHNRLQLTAHENSVLAGALSPDDRLAATGDADGVICVWSVETGRRIQRLASDAARPWAAGWQDDQTIAWGITSDYRSPNERGPLEFAFRIDTLETLDPGEIPFRAVTRRAGAELRQPDNAAILVVHRPGMKDIEIAGLRDYDQIRCFTFLDDRTLAVGSDLGLTLVDAHSGRPLRALRGHMGTVWALAPSPGGRYLLSAADDRSLRIWDWRAGKLLLSFFFARQQWIAWTPEGYYAASPAGEKLMGWQVNRLGDPLGSFYPAVQFRSSLYRPELIRHVSAAGSVEQALRELADDSPRESQVTTVAEVLPPEVAIVEPASSPFTASRSPLTVRARARSRGEQPVTALRLLLDGRPYEGRKGVYVVPDQPASDDEVDGQWEVELVPGTHRLTVQAETPASKALSSEVTVHFEKPVAGTGPRLPDLYVLAVGVAAYPGPLRLAYADHDAQEFVTTLQSTGAPLFRSAEVKLLTNQQATQREMLRGLSWLRREMTQQDVCVFFFSGHGAKDEANRFYLVPVDGDPQDLLATGLSDVQLKDALAAIPGRILVLLDACHAGAAGGDRRKAPAALTDDLVRDLATDDYGVIVMCSSMGREYSMESDQHGQGYFTLALVEALQGHADYNGDGVVYLTELDTYVADRVKMLTEGQQHPVTSKPATIRTFPISRAASGKLPAADQ